MNTSSPYDQLLAAKLDQVPVPDMADSIWSAIDTQLDAPTDASTDTPKNKTARKIKGKGWYGFLGTITVVTLLWWGYNHMNHTPPQNKPPQNIQPATKDSSAAADTSTVINPVKKKNMPVKPVIIKKDSTSLHDIPIKGAVVDSVSKQTLPPVHIDSPLHINNVPLPHVDSVRNNPPPGRKKGKGVKINNDDYKISADKGG